MDSDGTLIKQENLVMSLEPEEKLRLVELEQIIDRGIQTFYEVGKALEEIRDRKLYRETHKTFESYCQEKWQIARQTANRYIRAVKVMEILEPIGSKIPTKESQVRPLTGLPESIQLEIWQEALEQSPNGMPTGAAVSRLVEEKGYGKTKNKSVSELEHLRLENYNLKEKIQQQQIEKERRAAQVAKEFEKLRAENTQLKLENRQLKAELQDMKQKYQILSDKYEKLLTRLERIEGAKV